MVSPRTLYPLGALLLAAFIVAFLPTAQAAVTITAPYEFVGLVTGTQSYAQVGVGPAFSSQMNWTFTVSPEDPDQINGSWNYTIWLNDSSPNGWTHLSGNRTHSPVNDRPGWLYIQADTFTANNAGYYTPTDNGTAFIWNLTVSDYLGSISQPTCSITVVQTDIGRHDQCGNITLTAPNIVNVSITQVPTTTQGGQANFVWEHSTDDPNANTTGDFDYQVFRQIIYPGSPPPPCNRADTLFGDCDPGSPSTTFGSYFLSPSGTGNLGLRYYNETYGGTAPFYFAFDVTAVDNETHLWGTQSCQTIVDAQRLFDTQRCGIYLNSTISIPVQGNPVFPGLNVTQLSTTTGVSLTNAGYAMAAFLVLGLAIAGFIIAGKAGSGIAGALGASLAFTFNLLEAWAIVTIFTIAVILIVLGAMSGGKKR